MPTPSPNVSPAPAAKPKSSPSRGQKELRDTMESIVIAFVLAFLFRTFEAEAFVIPTGSMAPTLYGRHKETLCHECGYKIVVGASDEVDPNGYLLDRAYFVEAAFCPNCRARNSFDRSDPVFNGDRILVNKYPYEFGDPDRWDVIVFKYPEEPKTNYIKRLVGLPGETLTISQGDVFLVERGELESPDDDRLTILRKDDPTKQQELQIPVYDDRFPATDLLQLGWPARWAAMEPGRYLADADEWTETDIGWNTPSPRDAAGGGLPAQVYTLTLDDSRGDRPRWIRYRHLVPERSDWAAVEMQKPEELRPRPELITDFCGYNAYISRDPDAGDGLFWVGDLTITGAVQVLEVADGAELVFELIEGERTYRCRIDPASGAARLTYADAGDEQILASATTAIRGPGNYTFSFANVDNQLRLWIDGEPVAFNQPTTYPPLGGAGALQAPTVADLVPVGIGAANIAAQVSQLVLTRDIYYRNEFMHPDYERTDGLWGESTVPEYAGPAEELQRLAARPGEWFDEYTRRLAAAQTGPDERFEGVDSTFVLGPDEFFGMGDNSPRSRDSRLWPNQREARHRYAIPRTALVGKAFFIYWPHGVPFLNDGQGYPSGENPVFATGPLRGLFYHRRHGGGIDTDYPQYRVPFYPNVERMHRIR